MRKMSGVEEKVGAIDDLIRRKFESMKYHFQQVTGRPSVPESPLPPDLVIVPFYELEMERLLGAGAFW